MVGYSYSCFGSYEDDHCIRPDCKLKIRCRAYTKEKNIHFHDCSACGKLVECEGAVCKDFVVEHGFFNIPYVCGCRVVSP